MGKVIERNPYHQERRSSYMKKTLKQAIRAAKETAEFCKPSEIIVYWDEFHNTYGNTMDLLFPGMNNRAMEKGYELEHVATVK